MENNVSPFARGRGQHPSSMLKGADPPPPIQPGSGGATRFWQMPLDDRSTMRSLGGAAGSGRSAAFPLPAGVSAAFVLERRIAELEATVDDERQRRLAAEEMAALLEVCRLCGYIYMQIYTYMYTCKPRRCAKPCKQRIPRKKQTRMKRMQMICTGNRNK